MYLYQEYVIISKTIFIARKIIDYIFIRKVFIKMENLQFLTIVVYNYL